MTLVDRRTICVTARVVDTQLIVEMIQHKADAAPQGAFYFSGLLAQYRQVIYYPGLYTLLSDTSETYRVEGDNAELCHYPAHLARRSLCILCCIEACRCAIKVFVYAWNSRQLYKASFPVIRFTSSISYDRLNPHTVFSIACFMKNVNCQNYM